MRTLGLDLDGVTYPWHEAVYDFYKNFRNYNEAFSQFWTTFYKTLTKEDWEFLVSVDTLYSCIPVSKSMKSFLERIAQKYEIYYITGRPESVKLTTEQYLERSKFPFYENLIFSNDKASYARLYKMSYFVDDIPDNVKELSKVTNTIMMARPYNKDYWGEYKTAFGLKEILEMVEA